MPGQNRELCDCLIPKGSLYDSFQQRIRQIKTTNVQNGKFTPPAVPSAGAFALQLSIQR